MAFLIPSGGFTLGGFRVPGSLAVLRCREGSVIRCLLVHPVVSGLNAPSAKL